MIDLLQQQANDLFNLSLTDTQTVQFETYASELVTWNEKMNLTGITDPDGIVLIELDMSSFCEMHTGINAQLLIMLQKGHKTYDFCAQKLF